MGISDISQNDSGWFLFQSGVYQRHFCHW